MSDVKDLIERARKAMGAIQDYSQAEVDAMVENVAKRVYQKAGELAAFAIEETGMGRLDSGTEKVQNIAKNVWEDIKDEKSVGVIHYDEETGITEVAHPAGVIGSVTPVTQPTITPLGNGMMALKGRNALVFSPHPSAIKSTAKTIEVMRDALAEVGAPKDLLVYYESPSNEATQDLMAHTDLIVATGGPGLVYAAYSSGTPAYGVGAGNSQGILDEDFDVDKAAELSVAARAFDNGLPCTSQQILFYPKDKEVDLVHALEKHQAHVITDSAIVDQLRDNLIDESGKFKAELIGKSPHFIGQVAGVEIPEEAEIVVAKITKNDQEEALTKEKLFPLMTMAAYDDFEEAVDLAKRNLVIQGGAGHSSVVFTNSSEREEYVGLHLPISRLMVNQVVNAMGGATNGLNTSVSLGCGTWGNNVISENLTYRHLLNVSRISDPIDLGEIDHGW
ncbi:aldehyde dehydrogenase family protein [Aerococcus urinae]|uniref:aldehyde dehydrogenase family protein n=1 Tax=Aerococcus urinae TaxID=1376 RepID=UPI00227C25CA|nr:aldehyde dehydrogenase family protein [Aerococcus urinae]MCY3045903.1 aldehyde dehydrogenase family protein [Aerococcus urinae]